VPVRVVHISDCYLPRLGGIEVQVQGLARQQCQRGDEVHVITATGGTVHLDEGVLIHRFVAKLPFDLPIHPRAKKLIKRKLAELQPDVVHVHMGAVSLFAWAGIAASAELRIPSLTTVHSMWAPWTKRMYSVLRLVNRWDQSTQLAAVSDACAQLVRAATRQKVLITPNGVDLEMWRGGLQVDEIHQPLRLVSATRFSPRKRVMPLLKMMKQLHDSFGSRAPHLTIAGSGPQFTAAQKFVAHNNLQFQVELLGRLARTELKDLFAQSDAFIQLSELESFGLAAIEARAVGLPVFGRSGNGLAEYVQHRESGYLEDSDAAVKARIVECMHNPDELMALKKASVGTPPHHGWEFALAGVASGYRAAIEHLR
jgi:glycosyltransferase involved in cell wall biosynthesis